MILSSRAVGKAYDVRVILAGHAGWCLEADIAATLHQGLPSCPLKSGFRLPPLMFTDEKAFAVMLGLRGLRHLGLSAFTPATEGAAAKLTRVLPETLRNSAQTIEEVIGLEPVPWVVSTSAEALVRVATGLQDGRATQRV